MKHNLETHTNCERPHCPICDGGLEHCLTCDGAEATLPTDCPGRMLTWAEEEAIMSGHLNYADGKWYTRGPGLNDEWILSPDMVIR